MLESAGGVVLVLMMVGICFLELFMMLVEMCIGMLPSGMGVVNL